MSLVPMFSVEQFAKGVAARRELLGSEYVDESLASIATFMKPLQRLIRDYCWSEIWTRPVLDRKTRSITNLPMLTGLNQLRERKLHPRGAIDNGVTHEQVRGVFLQTCIHCGVPAALESFKSAMEILQEEDARATGVDHG